MLICLDYLVGITVIQFIRIELMKVEQNNFQFIMELKGKIASFVRLWWWWLKNQILLEVHT